MEFGVFTPEGSDTRTSDIDTRMSIIFPNGASMLSSAKDSLIPPAIQIDTDSKFVQNDVEHFGMPRTRFVYIFLIVFSIL